MNTNLKSQLVVVASVVLCSGALVVGCQKDAAEPEPEETVGSEIPPAEPEIEPEPAPVIAAPSCALQTVYFAFDSSALDEVARTAIEAAVECFRSEEREAEFLLTGACDPRGTEEYNLALGDRRATAVRDYMRALGLDTSQVSVTSVGEEFATGTDEAGWAKDRNVTASQP